VRRVLRTEVDFSNPGALRNTADLFSVELEDDRGDRRRRENADRVRADDEAQKERREGERSSRRRS
jgi:hypothetical protein